MGLLVDGWSVWSGSSCGCWSDFVWFVLVAWVVSGCSVVGMFSSPSAFRVSACFWVLWFVGDAQGLDVGGVMSFTGGCLVEIGVLLWFMFCGSVWIFAILDFSVVPSLGVFGCSIGYVRCCWL